MERYLIDTNVVSDYFSASLSPVDMVLLVNTIDMAPNLSVITEKELLCWKTDINTMQKVKEFIGDSVV